MEDNRIPRDAEPAEQPAEAASFYGTSVPKTPKSSHVGLIVFLCLLVILLCSTQMLVLFFGIRLVKTDRGWTLRAGSAEQPAQAEPQQVLRTGDPEAEQYRCCDAPHVTLLAASESGADPQDSYERVSASVLCISVERLEETAVCSGVLVTSNGYALTCCGDMRDAVSLNCLTKDGTSCAAAYLGTDPVTGLSLLKLGGQDYASAQFGSAGQAAVGQRIFSVGNPNGTLLRSVLREGMVTAFEAGASLQGTALTLLQTSAEFESGGLGCPIVDGRGLVIAVTTALPGQDGEGVFAVASDDLQSVIDRILAANPAAELDIGLDAGQIPALCTAYYHFPGSLWVRQVSAPQLAAAGLYERDVIVEADGVPVATWEELNEAIAAHEAGQVMELLIYRGGEYYRARLTVQMR